MGTNEQIRFTVLKELTPLTIRELQQAIAHTRRYSKTSLCLPHSSESPEIASH
ncbi:hypothetical protein [Nostoc sp.]|uniref:hypothetical protein n=1 Tax=Nostoc sp. TaxID=1180 RepID=UPI003593DCC9